MKDDEIICSWMEWHPATLTLDRLYEVEEKLNESQQMSYWLALTEGPPQRGYWHWRLVHASAEQKIKALARVIGEESAQKEAKP